MFNIFTEIPSTLLTVYFVIFGLLLGSFANVVIYRWPLGLSVVKPRSHCFQCKNLVRWYDNIPVLSWLLLRGKCRHCKAQISIRYPLVEILMGVLFGWVYVEYGWTFTTLEYCIFIFGLVAASFIDIDHFLLPDVITLSGIVIGVLGSLINPERTLVDSLLGVVLGGGFLWSVAYFYFVFRKEEGMGGGDIKLLAWIGAILGFKAIPFVILTSTILGSVFGVILNWKSKEGLKSVIPFGPYLALGALIHIFGGKGLGEWYFSLFFP